MQCLLVLQFRVEFCVRARFCDADFGVLYSFSIILLVNREIVALS